MDVEKEMLEAGRAGRHNEGNNEGTMRRRAAGGRVKRAAKRKAAVCSARVPRFRPTQTLTFFVISAVRLIGFGFK